MIGEISAVATALLWALSSIMIKSASQRMGAIPLNAIRATAGAIFILVMLVVVGKTGDLAQVSLVTALYLVGAVIIGMGVGDTLYFRSIALVGVSRALPASNIYPLFTMPIAVVLLGEGLTWLSILGTAIVVIGVTLVGRTSVGQVVAADMAGEKFKYAGILMALGAAFCWALSTVIQGRVLAEIDVLVANSIRIPVVALILVVLATRSKEGLAVRTYGWHSLLMAVLTGVATLGLGGLLFLFAIQEAGASRTASLSAISPIFGAPLALIFLKEKLTLPLFAGTILTVAGVWLIVI